MIDNVVLDKGSSTGDGYYFRAVDKMYVSDGNGSTILGNPAGWNRSGRWINVGYALVSATSLGNGSAAFTYTYDYTIGWSSRPADGRGSTCSTGPLRMGP